MAPHPPPSKGRHLVFGVSFTVIVSAGSSRGLRGVAAFLLRRLCGAGRGPAACGRCAAAGCRGCGAAGRLRCSVGLGCRLCPLEGVLLQCGNNNSLLCMCDTYQTFSFKLILVAVNQLYEPICDGTDWTYSVVYLCHYAKQCNQIT